MSEPAPSTDQVRAYLDRAVVDAADRWVGRSLDATAYADLVAAVLARREATGADDLTRPLDSGTARTPRWAEATRPPERPEPPETRDPAMDHLPDHPDLKAWHGDPLTTTSTGGIRVESNGAVSYGPTSYELVTSPDSADLPTRPPGRHRSPATPEPAPTHIDLSEDLTSVLSWLGQPDT